MSKKNKQTKQQYNINIEAAKILASGKINECGYLTNTEILPSNQSRIVEQAKCTYSPPLKAFGNQTNTIEDQGKNSQRL